MDYTTNLNLKKPALTDFALITDIDDNMDVIDAEIAKKQDTITGAASSIVSSDLTPNRAICSNSSGKVYATAITNTEIGRLSGLTGNVQTQIDSLKRHVVTEAGTDLDDYTTNGMYYFTSDYAPENIPDGLAGILLVFSLQASDTALTYCKQIWLKQGNPGVNSFKAWERSHNPSGWGVWVQYLTAKDLEGAVSSILSSNLTASRALVSNSSGKVGASSTTATELGYVHGVTSAIQTQLDAKQATITGAATSIVSSDLATNRALCSNASGKVYATAITNTEVGRLSGVTGNIQTQLDGKQATVTGAATTITGSNLTTSRALVSNGDGKVAVSAVTSTELGYLDGVTSNVQTQLDGKQATVTGSASTITSGSLTANRALISNGSQKVAVSSTTSTELGYVHGVTSAIQTQINGITPNYVLKHRAFNNVNIANSTTKKLGDFTLTAGLWILTLDGQWSENENGIRRLYASTTETGGALSVEANSSMMATTGTTVSKVTFFMQVTESTTYYVVGYQTSGSTINCSVRINAIRLST